MLAALLGLLSVLSLPVLSQSPSPSTGGLALARAAQQRYSVGQFDEAAKLWQQAAEQYEQAGDRQGTTKSLIDRSQALQNLGLYPKACDTLLQAFAVDTLECRPPQLAALWEQVFPQALSLTEAVGLRSLGHVLRRQGFLDQSQDFLRLSLAATRGTPQESATLLSLGNTERALAHRLRDRLDYEQITAIIDRQSVSAALEPYQETVRLYRTAARSASPLISVQAQLNHLSLLLNIQQWWSEQISRRTNSWSRLKQTKLSKRAASFSSQLDRQLDSSTQRLQRQLWASVASLPSSRAAINARINYANCLIRLQQLDRAKAMLATAQEQARAIADWQAQSYTLGYLGRISFLQGQIEPALDLTRQALLLAQEHQLVGDSREISYLWQFQLGRLLQEQNPSEAIAAYAAAYNTLQSLRSDLNANNQDLQFDFREEVKPVYLGLVDLLLQAELTEAELASLVLLDTVQDELGRQEVTATSKLKLARNIIESLQLAELDNFFQDPCVEESAVAVQLDDLDPRAAVLYPIVLPDRVAVILSLPDRTLRASATPIGETAVNATLDTLYDRLDNPTVDNSARNILSTSNPIQGELAENLQSLLPMLTQVYDWLIRPFETELATSQIETLVFVLNGQLQKVPMAALYDGQHYLLENYQIALAPSLQLLNPNPLDSQRLRVLAAGVSQPAQVRGETFPALDNVPEELNQIQSVFPRSRQLLNEEFTVSSLQTQLQEDFPVVHFATHAQFSSNPEQNFIVTGQDSSLGIEQLSNLFQAESAPELLVLSACQTATGDEQAVLGLAGVAVRSGIRSTLATLWPVEDVSTAQLMGQFYQELAQPTTQSEALRSAQLSLLDRLKVNPPMPELQGLPPHPYYWAPYVLVGNWQ
ncbi:MAG: CHAT domain-containing protein [Cyanophyceae cyanobacterium]